MPWRLPVPVPHSSFHEDAGGELEDERKSRLVTALPARQVLQQAGELTSKNRVDALIITAGQHHGGAVHRARQWGIQRTSGRIKTASGVRVGVVLPSVASLGMLSLAVSDYAPTVSVNVCQSSFAVLPTCAIPIIPSPLPDWHAFPSAYPILPYASPFHPFN